jgi:hypothetical protein
MKTDRYSCHTSEAGISSDKQYRWWLHRVWDETKPVIIWIMMNPSTADHTKNDPTIMKVMRYSQRWGYGSVIVLNLYAYRASNPEDLPWNEDERIGHRNNWWIEVIFGYARAYSIPIICAWGAKHKERGHWVRRVAAGLGLQLQCLEVALNGEPKHPRFLSETLDPQLM